MGNIQPSSTTVTTSMDRYRPTIDLAQITIWDAMKLVDLITSLSTIINAAMPDDPAQNAVTKYLDDWQALMNDAAFDIADVVLTMEPTEERERRARNWLLAKVRLPLAEGLVDIVGPGEPSTYADAFSRVLIARGQG